jgi:hypothetical protein
MPSLFNWNIENSSAAPLRPTQIFSVLMVQFLELNESMGA